MAVIGTAYVEVRALTDKINGDISRSLSSQTRTFENAGRQYNAALQRGLSQGGVDLAPSVNTADFERATDRMRNAARDVADDVRDSSDDIEDSFSRAGGGARNGFLQNFGSGQISAYMKRLFYQILFGIPAIGALVGALSSLVSGLFAVGSAVGPAVGALATLPGIAAAAATGIGALVVSFGGIGAAYKAGTAAATGGGGAISKAAQRSQEAVEAANDRIARSQRGLRDAYEDAAESIERAARAVSDAEESLADALEDSRRAQTAVNTARKEAIRNLREMQWGAEDASIAEGKAAIALARAQEELQKVAELKNIGGPSQRIYDEAQLNYRQAVLDLEQAKQANIDAADASADAAQKGVENSDAVVRAREDEADAARDVRDAQRDLADAQAEQAKTQRDAAESIADAQKELADAQKDLAKAMSDVGAAAGGAGGGVDKFAEAMAKLSPEAQSFVRYLISLQDTFRAVRNEAGKDLFPALESSLRTIVGNGFLDLLASGLRTAGRAIGTVATGIADLTGNEFFRGNLGAVFASNEVVIGNFGRALVSIVNLLTAVAAAAAPVTEAVSAWVATKADEWLGRAQGDMDGLAGAVERGAGVVRQLARIFGLLWDAIKTVGGAAQESGQGLLDSFEDALVSLNNLLTEPGRSDQMREYFSQVADNVRAVGDLFNSLALEFIKLGDNPAVASIADQFAELGPAIGDLLSNALESVGPVMADALGQLVGIFDTLASGGGLEQFVSIIDSVAGALNSLFKMPGMDVFIRNFAVLFATYKAFSLVANVFQIGKIFSGIGGAISSSKALVDGFRGISSAATAAAGRSAAVGEALRSGLSGVKSFGSAIAGAAGSVKSFIATQASLLASQVRGAAVWAAQTAKIVAQRVAMVAAAAAQRAVAIAAQVWAVAQRVLNAALNANPIGLIITAITLLVAAIVYAWNNSETFRDIVMGVWDAILGAVRAVVDWFTGTLVPALQGVWDSVSSGVQAAWDFVMDIITGVADAILQFFLNWTLIGIIISNWDTIVAAVQTAWNFVLGIVTTVGNAIASFFSGLWSGITTAVSNAWNFIVTVITTYVNTYRTIITTVFTAVSSFISGVWSGLQGAASAVWNGIVSTVVNIVNGFRNTIIGVFTGIRDGIANIWNGLGGIISGAVSGLLGIIRGPVNAVVRAVNGIIDNINGVKISIPDWVPGLGGRSFGINIPRIPQLALGGTVAATPGGVLAQIAEGGRDERVTPLNADGMSAGETAMLEVLQGIAADQRGTIQIVLNAPPETDLPTLAALVSRELAFRGR